MTSFNKDIIIPEVIVVLDSSTPDSIEKKYNISYVTNKNKIKSTSLCWQNQAGEIRSDVRYLLNTPVTNIRKRILRPDGTYDYSDYYQKFIDPRGFEFCLSYPNLGLGELLSFSRIDNGYIRTGCVLGFDKTVTGTITTPIILPVSSVNYQNYIETTKQYYSSTADIKNLKPGHVYVHKNAIGSSYRYNTDAKSGIYLGKVMYRPNISYKPVEVFLFCSLDKKYYSVINNKSTLVEERKTGTINDMEVVSDLLNRFSLTCFSNDFWEGKVNITRFIDPDDISMRNYQGFYASGIRHRWGTSIGGRFKISDKQLDFIQYLSGGDKKEVINLLNSDLDPNAEETKIQGSYYNSFSIKLKENSGITYPEFIDKEYDDSVKIDKEVVCAGKKSGIYGEKVLYETVGGFYSNSLSYLLNIDSAYLTSLGDEARNATDSTMINYAYIEIPKRLEEKVLEKTDDEN